jgi:hypothetical protein
MVAAVKSMLGRETVVDYLPRIALVGWNNHVEPFDWQRPTVDFSASGFLLPTHPPAFPQDTRPGFCGIAYA